MQHRLMQIVAAAALALAANAGAATPSKAPVESKCLVLMWVRFTGQVQVAQVVKSSGAPRLDEACVRAVLNQSMEPGSRDGILSDTWMTLPILWKLQDSGGHAIPVSPHEGDDRPIPRLAQDQALNLGEFYDPRAAQDQHLEAICSLHVRISADAVVESVRVERSTGIAALDQASVDALYAANFVAAAEDGKPVAAESDIWLAWGRPRPAHVEKK